MTESYISIYDNIRGNRLLKAIGGLRSYIENSKNPKAIDKIERIESTYGYLLKYMREGHPDPTRDRLLNDIKEDLYDLAATLKRESEERDSPKIFHTHARLVEISGLNFSEALGRFISSDAALQLSETESMEHNESLKAKNMALKDIFNVVWTLPVGRTDELKEVVNVAADGDISFSLRGVIVSAIVLSLLSTYDRARLKALLAIEERTDSERLKARALSGIALTLDRYGDRIALDPDMRARFESLSDNITFYTRLREIVYSLVKARGGMKFLERIKSEIIPDMQKFGPDFINKLKNARGELNIDSIEENPDWENMLRKSGMGKKLRRLNDMQSSGADMMLSMFEQASRQPLFNDVDTWFRPFEEWEAERLGVPGNLRSIMSAIFANPTICDTDKFSMLMGLGRMPASSVSLLKSTFEAQNAQLTEEMKEMMLHTKAPEFDMECYNFARTLFRFFTYSRFRNEFDNPFARALRYSDWPFFGEMLREKEIDTTVAEFYHSQGFYDDAIRSYKGLLNRAGTTLDDSEEKWDMYCLQKIGSSLENLGRKKEALNEYEKAFSLSGTDMWLAKRIVRLSLELKSRSSAAVGAMRLLYEKNKDNPDLVIPYAKMMLELSEEDGDKEAEASRLIDRAYYLAPDNLDVRRLRVRREYIHGRASVQLHKLLTPLIDNAEMYLASISLSGKLGNGENPDQSVDEERDMCKDLSYALYAGFAMNDFAKAIEYYKSIKSMPNLHPDAVTVRIMIEEELKTGKRNEMLDRLLALLPVIDDSLAID